MVVRDEMIKDSRAKTRKASRLTYGSGYYSSGKGKLLEHFKKKKKKQHNAHICVLDSFDYSLKKKLAGGKN